MKAEKLDLLVKELRNRQVFKAIQAFLRDKGYSVPGSWDRLKSRMADPKNDAMSEDLLEYYTSIRLRGRKHIFFFRSKLRQEQIQRELAHLDDAIAKSPFRKAYPLPADIAAEIHEPTLTAVHEDGDYLLLVFCSHRVAIEEVPLDAKWLSEDAPEEYAGAQLRAVVQTRQQACDIVAIPRAKDAPIEFRIDRLPNATKPNYRDALGAVKGRLNAVLSATSSIKQVQLAAVNLYPALAAIYDNNDEGVLHELAFWCSTEARRREIIRTKDLREEVYHKTGVKAIGGSSKLKIYRLGIHWDTDTNGVDMDAAEVTFPGTLSQANSPNPWLDEARLDKSMNERAFSFVVDKVLSYADGTQSNIGEGSD